MGEFFSDTAYKRLPVAVRKMPKEAQTTCIFLRLRKTEEQISMDIGLSPEETSRIVNDVKRVLIVSGNYDMVASPTMVSLDAGTADGRPIEPAAVEAGMEDSLLLKNFIQVLKESLKNLTSPERKVLHLFFERRMTGTEILEFFGKTGLQGFFGDSGLKSGSDVFYFIDKALKKLLSKMDESTPIGRGTLTVKGLKEILAHTGVEA